MLDATTAEVKHSNPGEDPIYIRGTAMRQNRRSPSSRRRRAASASLFGNPIGRTMSPPVVMGKTAKGASRSRVRHGVMHLQLATGPTIRHFFQYGRPEYTAGLFHEPSRLFVASDAGGDGGDDDFNLQIGEGEPEGGAPSVIMFEIRGVNDRSGLYTAEVNS